MDRTTRDARSTAGGLVAMTARGSTSALVSVITPCYNSAEYLERTLDAVQTQEYRRLEHIVVDDASTDGTGSIIERFGSRVVPVFLDRNHGAPFCRNRGAELARGDFLMFLDSDDLIDPWTIGGLVDAVRDRSGDLAFCDWQRLRRNESGEWVAAPKDVPLPTPETDLLQAWITGECWIPPCALLWTRQCFDATGGWDEKLVVNQDGDIAMRALLRGAVVRRAAVGMGYYRQRTASISRRPISPEWVRSQKWILDKLTVEAGTRGATGRLGVPLRLAFFQLGYRAALLGDRELSDICFRDASRAHPRPVEASTRLGAILTRLFGLRRKEQVIRSLAGLGLATATRQKTMSNPPVDPN